MADMFRRRMLISLPSPTTNFWALSGNLLFGKFHVDGLFPFQLFTLTYDLETIKLPLHAVRFYF
jgi:hypothetical protein